MVLWFARSKAKAITIAFLLGIAPVCVSAAEADAPPKREITAKDAVRLVEFGDPNSLTWLARRGEPVTWAPDRQHFVVIERWGDPDTAENVGQLMIFDLRDIVHPVQSIAFRSASNFQPVALARWVTADTLFFAGTRGTQPTQIYKLQIGADPIQLTSESGQIKTYEVSRGGDRLVWFLSLPQPQRPDDSAVCASRGCRIEPGSFYDASQGTSVWDLVLGGELVTYDITSRIRKQWGSLSDRGGRGRRCAADFLTGLSPSGRYAILRCYVDHWPAWWAGYAVAPEMSRLLNDGNSDAAAQLYVLDLNDGTTRQLTGAPENLWSNTRPAWLGDGDKLVVPDALEPLVGVADEERILRGRSSALLIIDIPSGQTVRLYRSTALADQLVIAEDGGIIHLRPALNNWRAWRRGKGGWRLYAPSTPRSVAPSISIKVEQSVNEPPKLVAYRANRQEVLIRAPNAWLSDYQLGSVENVEWRSDGKTWKGQIFYPPRYSRGRAYPMVMQTHGVDSGSFSLVGITGNFSARALAARGIIVLQVAENDEGVVTTPQEWATVQRGYEAAIDYMKSRSLILPSKIGIVGWSRTGWTTAYTLTHSNYYFAAAAFVLSGDGGLWEHLIYGFKGEMESDFGSIPVGEGLKNWLDTSPSFSMHRMNTPMLMYSRTGSLMHWDWFSILARLHRPVEYWQLADPTHEIFRIDQRISTTARLVDWFDFWLNDHPNVDPENLARWQPMRKLQEDVERQQRPPLINWLPVPKR